MNPQAKSQLAVLASARTPYKNDKLNDVRFSMSDIIKAPEQHYAAMVSLQSMNFFNSFHNITTQNNVLQLIMTHDDEGVLITNLSAKIIITPGIYDTDSLKEAINADAIFSIPVGTGPTSTLSLDINRNTAKCTITGYTIASLNTLPTAIRSVGLLATPETRPLMTMLGFFDEIGADAFSDIQPIPGTEYKGVCFEYTGDAGAITLKGAASSILTPSNPPIITGPNLSNVTTTPALQIELNGIRSDVKAGTNLSRGATISIVPVTAGYGSAVNFYPPNPHKSMVTNMYLSEFHITIKDASTGQYVDFNGVDWIMAISIDWVETETMEQSDLALNNVPRKTLPMYHSQTFDHLTLPTGLEVAKKRKKDVVY